MYETQKAFDFVSILETLFGFRKILSKKIPERTTIILKAIWDGTKPFLGFRFRSKKSFVLHLFFQCTTCQNHIFVKLNSHIVIIYLRWNNVNDNNNLEPPRSSVTNSINARLRPYTTSYTTVYIPFTLRIRPYFSVLHGPVLRPYITMIVYGEIRRNTETVYGAFTLGNDRILENYGT